MGAPLAGILRFTSFRYAWAVLSSKGASSTGMGSPISSCARFSPSMGRDTAINCAPGCEPYHSLTTSRAPLLRGKGISLKPSRRTRSRGFSFQVPVASLPMRSLYILYLFSIYSSRSNIFPSLSTSSYVGIYNAGTGNVPSGVLAMLNSATVFPMPPSPVITTFRCASMDQLSLMISHMGQLSLFVLALPAWTFPCGSICLCSFMFGYSLLSISSTAMSWKLGWMLRFCFSTSARYFCSSVS